MKIDVDEEGIIELEEVFEPIVIKSDREEIVVCVRDGILELKTKEMGGPLGDTWNYYKVEGGLIGRI